MNHLLQYFVVVFLAWLAKILPIEVATWIARRAGDLSFLILGKRRRIALENLDKAFGGTLSRKRKWQIARSAFQSASLSMVELFIVEKVKKEASAKKEKVAKD